MVSPTTTREVLYVAATRGRESNRLYVDVAYDPDPDTSHEGMTEQQTVRAVLAGVLANQGADLSAHETLRRAQHHAEDFTVLAGEYQTMAREAQEQRWDTLLGRCGLDGEQLVQVRESEAYGPLLAALRDAEARGLNAEAAFPKLVVGRPLDDAEDPAAVLHERVDRWVSAAGSRRQAASNLIAGLIPRAGGIADPDMARALSDRDQAMERRAREMAGHAVEHAQVWASRLGTPPSDPAAGETWMQAVSTVAAYRDRWGIGNDHRPLGPERAVKTIEAIGHRKRAQAAAERALGEWKQNVPKESRTANLVGELYELLAELDVRSWDLSDPLAVNRLGTLARLSSLLADYESVRRRARPDPDSPGEQVGGPDRGLWYYRNLGLHIINYAQGAYEGFEGEADFALDAVGRPCTGPRAWSGRWCSSPP
ncbi:MAG TPA: hypothetical protein VG184_11795 [Acidimicrobiales bacterium]|nr:hypothetical protein [Acidimicrobiales bacterium]